MGSPAWTLDPRLAADTHPLLQWPVCDVRLMDDQRWPWLVLVPRIAGARELLDLPPSLRAAARDEIDRASAALRTLHAPHKLNVAALGNVVAQLHVHVIGRRSDDAAWPRPVWGVGERVPYPPAALDAALADWRRVLAG